MSHTLVHLIRAVRAKAGKRIESINDTFNHLLPYRIILGIGSHCDDMQRINVEKV